MVSLVRWRIDMNEEAQATWNGDTLTYDDRLVISEWAEVVRRKGPDELQRDPGRWNDHALLYGYWKGCRASNFASEGRLIYYRFDEHHVVQILRITTTHDYREPRRD